MSRVRQSVNDRLDPAAVAMLEPRRPDIREGIKCAPQHWRAIVLVTVLDHPRQVAIVECIKAVNAQLNVTDDKAFERAVRDWLLILASGGYVAPLPRHQYRADTRLTALDRFPPPSGPAPLPPGLSAQHGQRKPDARCAEGSSTRSSPLTVPPAMPHAPQPHGRHRPCVNARDGSRRARGAPTRSTRTRSRRTTRAVNHGGRSQPATSRSHHDRRRQLRVVGSWDGYLVSGGAQDAQSWNAYESMWETIVNERPVPVRSAQRDAREPIPVTVRIHWERSGIEYIDTDALGWTTGWSDPSVRVRLDDKRRHIRAVWVAAVDVTRRAPVSG